MQAQFLKYKKQWSAYTTINCLSIQEYGDTEKEALRKLADRIAASEFFLKGIKIKL